MSRTTMSILALIVMLSAFAAAERVAAEAPASQVAIPDFAPDAATSWALDQTVDDLLPPPAGPGPITFDPAHPYIANFRGTQPTYRVADLGKSDPAALGQGADAKIE